MSTLDWRLCADYRNHVGHFIVWKGWGGSKSVPCAYLMYLLCKWMYDARKRLIYLFTFRCSTTWGWQYQNTYTALTAHFWFCKISNEGPFVTQASIYYTHRLGIRLNLKTWALWIELRSLLAWQAPRDRIGTELGCLVASSISKRRVSVTLWDKPAVPQLFFSLFLIWNANRIGISVPF